MMAFPITRAGHDASLAVKPCLSSGHDARSEGIAYAEEGRELLKDAAGRPVCGGHDLAPGKRREVIPEIAPQDNVLVEPELDPATQADHELPFIDGDEARDVRQRLGEGAGPATT